MARNNAKNTAADRFRKSSSAVSTAHTDMLAAKQDKALRTIEGIDAKADMESDALGVWLPIAKLVANDTDSREAILSAMADATGGDIYWIASLFRNIVPVGNIVHKGAFKVSYDRNGNPVMKPLSGTRKVPSNMLSKAAYLEGVAELARQKTEASMLAAFQNAVADLIDAGKLKSKATPATSNTDAKAGTTV